MRFYPIQFLAALSALTTAMNCGAIAEPQSNFKCRSNLSSIERLICDDPRLAQSDRTLDRILRASLDQHPGSDDLRVEQLTWLKTRDATCHMPHEIGPPAWALKQTRLCLQTEYEERIAALREADPEADPFRDGGTTTFGAASCDGRKDLLGKLKCASFFGDAVETRRLVLGAKSTVLDEALRSAVSSGSLATVRVLIAAGANPDGPTIGAAGDFWSGRATTPLHIAALLDHRAVLDFLLTNGGDIHDVTDDGLTELALTVMSGQEQLVAAALAKRPAVDEMVRVGETPYAKPETALMIAAARGHQAIARMLIDAGANVNLISAKGYTALHKAAWDGQDAAMVSLLIKAGADPNVSNKLDGPPIARAPTVPVAQALLDGGADVNSPNSVGLTLLHGAALRCDPALMNFLVAHGANPMAKDIWGKTPYDEWKINRRADCPETALPAALRP